MQECRNRVKGHHPAALLFGSSPKRGRGPDGLCWVARRVSWRVYERVGGRAGSTAGVLRAPELVGTVTREQVVEWIQEEYLRHGRTAPCRPAGVLLRATTSSGAAWWGIAGKRSCLGGRWPCLSFRRGGPHGHLVRCGAGVRATMESVRGMKFRIGR